MKTVSLVFPNEKSLKTYLSTVLKDNFIHLDAANNRLTFEAPEGDIKKAFFYFDAELHIVP